MKQRELSSNDSVNMTRWEQFYNEKIKELLETSPLVIDIGGGLRLNIGKGDRIDYRNDWMIPLVKKIDYKILDIAPVYNADIVGDIHDLPLPDNSVDGIICYAVLEHVHNPIKAMEELYRVLKPGGKLFVYVPFLFYCHSHGDGHDYGDYWRFTHDTMNLLCKPFSSYEICAVKQPIETMAAITPMVYYKPLLKFARFLDTIFYKKTSHQVSGYHAYAIK